MGILPTYVCITYYLRRPENVIECPGTGVQMTESLCECWQLDPGPLEKRPVLLRAEPSLQPQAPTFFNLTQRTDILFPCFILYLVCHLFHLFHDMGSLTFKFSFYSTLLQLVIFLVY